MVVTVHISTNNWWICPYPHFNLWTYPYKSLSPHANLCVCPQQSVIASGLVLTSPYPWCWFTCTFPCGSVKACPTFPHSVAYVIKQLLEQGISLTTDPYPPSPKSPSSPDSHPSMADDSVCLPRLDSLALVQCNVDELKYESARLAEQKQQLSGFLQLLKTWKNDNSFSSPGKVLEFLNFIKNPGKMGVNLEK